MGGGGRTDADNGETLVGEDGSLTDNAAGPVRTAVSEPFGKSDEAGAVGSGGSV
jgi:hypothetical protein